MRRLRITGRHYDPSLKLLTIKMTPACSSGNRLKSPSPLHPKASSMAGAIRAEGRVTVITEDTGAALVASSTVWAMHFCSILSLQTDGERLPRFQP